MQVWTCPNTECIYDKQLESGQTCPLCGTGAQAFNFNEFGNLLEDKKKHKELVSRTERSEQIARKIKFCPKCGSPNINTAVFYRPSIWKCLDCGYEGALVIEDGTLAEKIQLEHQKALKKK